MVISDKTLFSKNVLEHPTIKVLKLNIIELFETPNTIGAFATLNGKEITIYSNKLNRLKSVFFNAKHINENGPKKTKKSKFCKN